MATAPKLAPAQVVQPAKGSVLATQAAQPAQNAVIPVQIVQVTNQRTDAGVPIYVVLLKNGTCAWIAEDQLM